MTDDVIKPAETARPDYVAAMDYESYMRGLELFDARCREVWSTHQAETRRAIRDLIPRTRGKNRAVILGSGPLYDVPLKELAAAFDHVLLMDVVHPDNARVEAGAFDNVVLVEQDVTGIAEAVKAYVDAGAKGPAPRPTDRPQWPTDADLVVSVNLASQLPLHPKALLEKKAGWTELQSRAFAKSMVEAHISALCRGDGLRCLITDVESLAKDGKGAVAARFDLLFGVKPPLIEREWLWDFAPPGIIDGRYHYFHRVIQSVSGG